MPDAAPGQGLGGLVLAAGSSDRMGVPKALLVIPARDGEAFDRFLIVDQVARLQEAGCFRVACVLGADAERIENALGRDAAGFLTCRNVTWPLGPFSSLQAGLQALGPCPRGVLVLPVDVPGVSALTMAQLVARAERAPALPRPPEAAVPTHEGRGGHPVWLSPQLAGRVLGEPPTARLDHLLAGLGVLRVEVDDARVRLNINRLEDWNRYLGETRGAR